MNFLAFIQYMHLGDPGKSIVVATAKHFVCDSCNVGRWF